MREITETFTAYRWDELDPAAQDTLIMSARNDLNDSIEYSLIGDDINGYVYAALNNVADMGSITAKTFKARCGLTAEWSLSYGQGDGVAIYGSLTQDDAPDLPWGTATAATLTRNTHGHHYAHENCFTVTAYRYDEDGYEIDVMGEDLTALTVALRGICIDAKRAGYRIIEQLTSVDEAKELLAGMGEVWALDGTRAMAVAQ